MSQEVGKVLGTMDAEPLGYWVAVPPEIMLQLDDVVLVRRRLSHDQIVCSYGIVDSVIARDEGARLESDVFLSEQGILPLNHTLKAQVSVPRIEPEIYVPPLPGDKHAHPSMIDARHDPTWQLTTNKETPRLYRLRHDSKSHKEQLDVVPDRKRLGDTWERG